jgi:hypothetical protein
MWGKEGRTSAGQCKAVQDGARQCFPTGGTSKGACKQRTRDPPHAPALVPCSRQSARGAGCQAPAPPPLPACTRRGAAPGWRALACSQPAAWGAQHSIHSMSTFVDKGSRSAGHVGGVACMHESSSTSGSRTAQACRPMAHTHTHTCSRNPQPRPTQPTNARLPTPPTPPPPRSDPERPANEEGGGSGHQVFLQDAAHQATHIQGHLTAAGTCAPEQAGR